MQLCRKYMDKISLPVTVQNIFIAVSFYDEIRNYVTFRINSIKGRMAEQNLTLATVEIIFIYHHRWKCRSVDSGLLRCELEF